jgi:hypothetical protein
MNEPIIRQIALAQVVRFAVDYQLGIKTDLELLVPIEQPWKHVKRVEYRFVDFLAIECRLSASPGSKLWNSYE